MQVPENRDNPLAGKPNGGNPDQRDTQHYKRVARKAAPPIGESLNVENVVEPKELFVQEAEVEVHSVSYEVEVDALGDASE